MSHSKHPQHRLPAGIHERLELLRTRIRSLAVAHAAIWGITALLGLMWIAILMDRQFVLFDQRLRGLLTLSCLVVAGWAAYRTARPMLARLGWLSTASLVDQELPEMEERWTTVSQIGASEEATPVSMAMAEQVRREAAAMAPLVVPKQLADGKQLWAPLATLGAMVVLTALLVGANWQHSQVLLQRFWTPWTNASVTKIQSITGNLIVPRGDSISLVASAIQATGAIPSKAVLVLANQRGQDAMEVPPTGQAGDQEGKYTYHIPALEGSFRYRWRCGDGQTEWHDVRAVERPAFEELELVIEPPAYADRPTFRKRLLPYRVSTMEGSQLRLRMKPTDVLRTLNIVVTDENEVRQTHQLLPKDDGVYEFKMRLSNSVVLETTMVSAAGLAPLHPESCRLNVVQDRTPVAQVHASDQVVALDEVLDIPFEAHDDHGIAKAELIVFEEVDGEQQIVDVAEIPLGEQRLSKHVEASASLDLAQYNATASSKFSYAIRVTDNRNLPKSEIDRLKAANRSRNAQDQGNETTSTNNDSFAASRPLSEASNSGAPQSSNDDPSNSSNASSESAANDSTGTTAGATRDDGKNSVAQTETTGSKPLVLEPNESPTASSERPTDESQSATELASANTKSNPSGSAPNSSDNSEEFGNSENPSNSKNPAGSKNLGADDPKTVSPDSLASQKTSDPTAADITPEEATNNEPSPENLESGAAPSEDAPPSDSSLANAKSGGSNRKTNTSPSEGSTQPSSTAALPPVEGDRTNLDQMVGQLVTTNLVRIQIKGDDPGEANGNQESKTKTKQLAIKDRLLLMRERLRQSQETLEFTYEAITQDPASISDSISAIEETDQRLKSVEQSIDSLLEDTTETPLAFAGLQMVTIGQSHVTPARDDLFAVIREPLVLSEQRVARALNHVSIALEELDRLTLRVERVQRERKLAEDTEEVARIYRLYVENMQRLLRESRENRHPLSRKMAVSEYSDAYLDRYREVLRLRQQMLSELGRMLADDPRLRARYTNMIRRRQRSLRARLGELRERQEELTAELSGWTQSPEHHDELWGLVAETRIQRGVSLVRSASELQDRASTQMPLALKSDQGLPAEILRLTEEIGALSRASSFTSRRQLSRGETLEQSAIDQCEQIQLQIGDLLTALETLLAEHAGADDVQDYGERRLAEARQLSLDASVWTKVVGALHAQNYSQLAAHDQQGVLQDTEALKVEIDNIESEFPGQLQENPPEALAAARQLVPLMETITFNQSAAVFLATQSNLEEAAKQEVLAYENLKQAEELFDVIRRSIADALDEIDPQDPNVADLQDPTLDEFLRRLEREPNAVERLGLGNRPRNLRVMSDWMLYQQNNPLGSQGMSSAASARQRAEDAMQPLVPKNNADADEKKRKESEEDVQNAVEKLRQRADDPDIDKEEAERLRKLADELEATMEAGETKEEQLKKWRAMAKADKLRGALQAIAQGEDLPDNQWNQLLSSLEKGLWQVRGRTPPEEFQDAIQQYQEQMRRLRAAQGSQP